MLFNIKLVIWQKDLTSNKSQNKYILIKSPQTDHPTSQYWNTGMVAAHRELAAEFNISIAHFTEMSSHNKVNTE